MHSFAAELFSGKLHNSNGDNVAKVVSKLAEKIGGQIWRCTAPPPPLHSQSGYNPCATVAYLLCCVCMCVCFVTTAFVLFSLLTNLGSVRRWTIPSLQLGQDTTGRPTAKVTCFALSVNSAFGTCLHTTCTPALACTLHVHRHLLAHYMYTGTCLHTTCTPALACTLHVHRHLLAHYTGTCLHTTCTPALACTLHVHRHLLAHYMYTGTCLHTTCTPALACTLHVHRHLLAHYMYTGTCLHTTCTPALACTLHVHRHLLAHYMYTGTCLHTTCTPARGTS